MARIRSIHPGLFTDEAFMTASPHARLLIIGVWTEAWDDGVFEWKPLTLKARLFPVDAVNVTELLAELVALGFVQQFDAGKSYGVIRNFQKYQRPKKPNSSGVLPESLLSYAGRVPNQSGTGGEEGAQMEDGGWRVWGEVAKDASKPASLDAGQREEFLEFAETVCIEAAASSDLGSFSPIAGLILKGTMSLVGMIEVIKARPSVNGCISSWKFYVKIIQDEASKPPSPSQGPPQVFVCKDDPAWSELCRENHHKPTLTKQERGSNREGWLFPVTSYEAYAERERNAA